MTLLQVENLTKSFNEQQGLFNQESFKAVNNISFSLSARQTLAIIGHNGAGKSTLAKMIAGIAKPSSGQILFNQKPLEFGDYQYRAKHIRMVFQDPNNAFNPRLNVGQILDAPLRLCTDLNIFERNQKIFDTLRLVGLYPDHCNVKIKSLSISQKQRVSLARALILDPKVIIYDDAFSSLDALVRTQLINLILDLQERLGLAYIYLGQNLGIIKHIADEILVMENGEMLEYGSPKQLFTHPKTEYTRRMVESHFGQLLTENAWQAEKR